MLGEYLTRKIEFIIDEKSFKKALQAAELDFIIQQKLKWPFVLYDFVGKCLIEDTKKKVWIN